MGADELFDRPVGRLVEDVAARTPEPGAGAVTALSVTLAAALATMVARFSDDADAEAACEGLRRRAEPLGDADGAAYGRYLAALRLPKVEDPDGRRQQMNETLSAATDVPVQMTEVASEVAGHASRLAREGNPRLRGDAITAALLAAAAARSAAVLVALNLDRVEAFRDDPRPDRTLRLAVEARSAADAVATDLT